MDELQYISVWSVDDYLGLFEDSVGTTYLGLSRGSVGVSWVSA